MRSAHILKQYYESILGTYEDASHVPPGHARSQYVARTSAGPNEASVDRIANTVPTPLIAKSVAQEPPRDPDKHQTNVSSAPAVLQKKFIEQGEHDAQAWARPSFMVDRPSGAKEDEATPPTNSALLSTTSKTIKVVKEETNIRPVSRYPMPGPQPVASSSKLRSTVSTSNNEYISLDTPPRAGVKRDHAQISTGEAVLGEVTVASPTSSKDSGKGKHARPTSSRTSSHGSHVDLAALASAASAQKRRRVEIGRTPSAEEVFIREASVQFASPTSKRSQDFEAVGRANPRPQPQKKRKVHKVSANFLPRLR